MNQFNQSRQDKIIGGLRTFKGGIKFDPENVQRIARTPMVTIATCLDMLTEVANWAKKTAAQANMPEFSDEVLDEIREVATLSGEIKHENGTVDPASVPLLNHLVLNSMALIGATMSAALESEGQQNMVIRMQQVGAQALQAEVARLQAENATLKAAASSKPLH